MDAARRELAAANLFDICAINVADRLEGWDVAMKMGPDQTRA
jgi:hypothetical protein